MRFDQFFNRGLSIIIGFVLGASAAPAQGVLTPPAGAPAPVYKTLSQVEPRTPVQTLSGVPEDCIFSITKPGSYYLTGKIVATSDIFGIKVTTGGVVLDLNGYEIAGAKGSTKSGIVCIEPNCAIRNGIVRNWGTHGVLAGDQCILENITATDNGSVGLYGGNKDVIRNCIAAQNGTAGFYLVEATTLDGCIATRNGAGIYTNGRGGRVVRCNVEGNTDGGIGSGGDGWIIAENTIAGNGGNGLTVGTGCSILNNTIYDNGAAATSAINGAGIRLFSGSNHVEGNHLANNKAGIFADASPGNEIVVRNTVEKSTSGTNYSGNSGNNAATFGPVVTAIAGANSFANLSIP